jgi:hypothetical protein
MTRAFHLVEDDCADHPGSRGVDGRSPGCGRPLRDQSLLHGEMSDGRRAARVFARSGAACNHDLRHCRINSLS